jgi:hypothetical protein
MRTAATVILLAFLCFSCSRSTPEDSIVASNEISQALVGKQVTIRGKFSLWGKVGPYIVLDNQQAVYLEATKGSFTWGKPYSEMEGKLVAASGTLRFYREPPLTNPLGRAVPVQRVSDHFYLAAETTQVRLIGP